MWQHVTATTEPYCHESSGISLTKTLCHGQYPTSTISSGPNILDKDIAYTTLEPLRRKCLHRLQKKQKPGEVEQAVFKACFMYAFSALDWVGNLFSHSILPCPLGSCLPVSVVIGLVDVGNFGDEGVIWVWVRQQRADGQQHFGNGQGWAPLFLQDIQADASLAVDIRMVDLRLEAYLGRLKRVIRREVNVDKEHAAGVG